jgi:hypothetical protein
VALYFFDFRSADAFSLDEEGMQLPDTEAAHEMALGAISDAARDGVAEATLDQCFAVEVRNGTGKVLEITAVFNSRIFWTQ